MFLPNVADALKRARSVFERRPQAALSENPSATASWSGGLATEVRDESGRVIRTDMPAELGGANEAVSPVWLFSAGLASCASTSILLTAASEGIVLDLLEVTVDSRLDMRGMLDMPGDQGEPVYAGPTALSLRVRIRSRHADADTLRKLVDRAMPCSPIFGAVQAATPLSLDVQVFNN